MTTDELLAKLDDEYNRLESELPAHYEAYGRHMHWYKDSTGYQSDKYDLDRKIARQKEIRQHQATIKNEVGRITS